MSTGAGAAANDLSRHMLPPSMPNSEARPETGEVVQAFRTDPSAHAGALVTVAQSQLVDPNPPLTDVLLAAPTLEAGVCAIDSLRRSSITELRSFANPTVPVKLAIGALCVLLGVEPTRVRSNTDSIHADSDDYMSSARKLLASPTKLLECLRNYDKDNMPSSTFAALTVYVTDPGFGVESMRKTSTAAAAICQTVHAYYAYAALAAVKPAAVRTESASPPAVSASATPVPAPLSLPRMRKARDLGSEPLRC
jgi:hypothetical protein